MPRDYRPWSELRTEVRRLLREEDSSQSYWTDNELRDRLNEALDFRIMELKTVDEGYFIKRYREDLVKDQAEYSLPSGTSRIRNVWRVFDGDTNRPSYYPLGRDERRNVPVYHSNISVSQNYMPTFRLRGPNIVLEPAPSFSESSALDVEVEILPNRIDNDADTLPEEIPLELETLIVLDTAVMAMAEEDSSGNDPRGGAPSHIIAQRQRYENVWHQFIQKRNKGTLFARRYNLGD